jgi:hypothetical protein
MEPKNLLESLNVPFNGSDLVKQEEAFKSEDGVRSDYVEPKSEEFTVNKTTADGRTFMQPKEEAPKSEDGVRRDYAEPKRKEITVSLTTADERTFMQPKEEASKSEDVVRNDYAEPKSMTGEFHDQGDAKWIVIRGPSRGHNDTPFGWPTPNLLACHYDSTAL